MPRIITPQGEHFISELKTEVALGNVPGWEILRRFGINADIDIGTEDIWQAGGTRILPATAAQVSVESTSVNDTVAGTGLRLLFIQGLDEDYMQQQEVVAMNGTTAVLTTNDYLRINNAFAASSGTSLGNEGDISLTIGANLQSFIGTGFARTQTCMYTVPANKSFLLTNVVGTSSRIGSANMLMQGQAMIFGTNTWQSAIAVNIYEGMYLDQDVFVAAPPKAEFKLAGTSTANNLELSGIFSGFLIDTGAF